MASRSSKSEAELKEFGRQIAKAEADDDDVKSRADWNEDGPADASEEEGEEGASEDQDPDEELAARMAEHQQTVTEEDDDGAVRRYVQPQGCPAQYVHKLKGFSHLQCGHCPRTTYNKHAMWCYVDVEAVRDVPPEVIELLRERMTWHMSKCGTHEDFMQLDPAIQQQAIRKVPFEIQEEDAGMRKAFRSAPPSKKRRRGGRRRGGSWADDGPSSSAGGIIPAASVAGIIPAGSVPKASAAAFLAAAPSAVQVRSGMGMALGNVANLLANTAAEHGIAGAPILAADMADVEVPVRLATITRLAEVAQRVSSALSAQNVQLLRLARDIHTENQILAASYVEIRELIDGLNNRSAQ